MAPTEAYVEVLSVAYRCPHCRKLYVTWHHAERHVRHCWRNPDRKPKLGEITSADDGGLLDPEWTPDWHPGKPGMCYTAQGWCAVPGYVFNSQLWTEEWPTLILHDTAEPSSWDYPGAPPVKVPFNRLTKAERMRYWDDLIEQHGDGEGA